MGAWCGHCRDIDIYIYNTEGDDQWSTFTSVDGFLLLYSPENLGIFQAEPGTKNTLPNLWGLRHIHGTELHAHTHTPTHIYTHRYVYIHTIIIITIIIITSSLLLWICSLSVWRLLYHYYSLSCLQLSLLFIIMSSVFSFIFSNRTPSILHGFGLADCHQSRHQRLQLQQAGTGGGRRVHLPSSLGKSKG